VKALAGEERKASFGNGRAWVFWPNPAVGQLEQGGQPRARARGFCGAGQNRRKLL